MSLIDDITSSEELAFNEDEVGKIIQTSVDTVLGPCTYEETKVAQWINDICESCMEGLAKLRKPFKYIVTCVIIQRTGSAVHTSVSCLWDNVSGDGLQTLVWPKERLRDTQNKTMSCIVTVFALSFQNQYQQ